MTSKAKKLVRSSIIGQVSFVLRVSISLFMTPFMLSHLGDHNYGLWILVASFSSFYGLLDLGLVTAVQRYLSQALGRNDENEANIVFNTSLFVFSLIGVISLLFVVCVAFLAHLFVKNASDILLFQKIVLLMGVGLALNFPMRSFWAIFPSKLRWDISINLDILNVFVKTVLIIVFFKKGYGLWALAIINFAADLMNNALNVFFSLRILPCIKISIKYFKKERVKKFLSYSIFSFISKVSGIIKFSIDTFVVSAFVGLHAVAIYSITIRLLKYFIQIISRSTGLMTPLFSVYESTNNYDAIRKYFLFVIKISSIISLLIGGLLVILGQSFIQLWVGEKYLQAYRLILILVIPFSVSLMQLPLKQLLYGISKHKFLSIAQIIEAICNLILSLILVRFWGLKGVALGTAIPLFFINTFVLPQYMCKVIDLDIRKYIFETIIPILLKSIGVLGFLWVLLHNIEISNFAMLFLLGAIYSVCYGITIFIIAFSREEQSMIFNALPTKILNILIKVIPWTKKLKY